MLSHYMSLSEYGYFALVVTISGGVIQISLPLTQAISPRMTALISQNNMSGMLNIYHKGTKLLSIMVISLVSMISYFSYELLYIWTDDLAASKWAAPVLFWYVIGTGIVSIWSIQHYLQYAFGNLEYEKKLYLILLPLSLPIIYFAVANYGAEGSGISLLIIYVILLI